MRDPRGGRQVVITGLGAVTPLGTGVPALWEGLVAGRSGIRRIGSFDPSALKCQIAGEVPDFDPSSVLDRKLCRRTDRYTQLALVATREAMADAGLPERLEDQAAERTGFLIGSGLGGNGTLVEQIAAWSTRGPEHVSPFFIPMAIANMASAQAAILTGALGPNYSTTSACASSGHSLGEAAEVIRRGDADVMIAGGSDAPVWEVTVAALDAMRALSARNDDPPAASRPFDRGRDGFVLAEGAALLVLEELSHAQHRGARIYAEVCGYGASADASHITRPAPGGSGALRAARRALEKGAIDPAEIDLISAHATSTPEGDVAELTMMTALLGERAPHVSITATKSAVGHSQGAAGAIAVIAAVKAMDDAVVPPTLNLQDPDPVVGQLDCTPLVARHRGVDTALVHAFAFGGQNAVLALRGVEA
ncbi:MAG: beta-ketoacyl-ACP synthase II [Candidatus Limnocylindrales bacterium]